MASTNFAGMGSGLDINSLITQLMGVERQPLAKLQARQDLLKKQVNSIDGITSRMASAASAAANLASPSKWGGTIATSADTSVATVSNSGTGSSGTLSFTVSALASAHALRSANTVSATSAQIATPASTFLIGRGISELGISDLSGATGVDLGKLDIAVARSSAAASKESGALTFPVTINASNNTIELDVNGVSKTVTIANGSYEKSAFATALSDALAAVSAGATAKVTDTGVAISTSREGSAATIQITGGNALATLGMSVDASATTGTDALLTIDGKESVVTNIEAGATINVGASASGSLNMKVSGGLRAGSAVIASVSTGDGSLSQVVDAINNIKSSTGITAAAVRVGTGSYRFSVSSAQTGAASKLGLNTASLTGLGSMLESSTATNAEVTIGSGAGAFTSSSAQNTFTDLMPGTNITVLKLGATTVTAEANNNSAAVAELVAKANTVLSYINDQSKASATAGGAGVLSGDASIRRFGQTVRSSVLSLSSTLRAGVSVDRSGNLTFDKAAYEKAYAENPDGVRDMFAQSTTALAGTSFLQAADRTQAGTYGVVISQAPTRALATIFDWSSSMAFTQGSLTATYSPNAAATATETAAGLNTFFSANNFGLAAAVDGNNVSVTASSWGTDGTFSLNSTSYAGNNVAGTIDGVAATGTGRVLYLPTTSTSQAAGLRLTITASSPGSLGSLQYNPGIAGALRYLSITSGENSSPLRAAKTAREARIKSADTQVAAFNLRLKSKESQLRKQYSALDSNIGRMNNVSSWLTQQTAQKNS